ncbi:MAG: lysophospholipid acyltransferase family protein [Acidimicrobiales bacterium]
MSQVLKVRQKYLGRLLQRLRAPQLWFELGDRCGRFLPVRADELVSLLGGTIWYVVASKERRATVRRNHDLILRSRLGTVALELHVLSAFVSYVRYYVDLFTTIHRAPSSLALRTTVENAGLFWSAYEQGKGVIVVTAHLGDWDYGAYWFAQQGCEIAAVVEHLEPEELSNWFVRQRKSMGVEPIFVGPNAVAEVASRLAQGMAVALVADRDISGTGELMDFFGERLRFPLGPALIAERTHAPVVGCFVYTSRSGQRRIVFGEPSQDSSIDSLRLRERVRLRTQAIVKLLEHAIERAPEQWHVFVPLEREAAIDRAPEPQE